MYRPLFLRMARLGTAPFSGQARFSSPRPDALPSLAALCFFLTGSSSPPLLLPGSLGLAGGEDARLVLRLEPAVLTGGAGEAADWKGRGELRSGSARFSFELSPDRLWAEEAGGWRRIVLPEGGAEAYARMDREECAAEGRESRILPKRARDMARAFANGKVA